MIEKTLESSETEGQSNLVQIVKVSRKHETGWIVLGDGAQLEISSR